MVLALMVAAAIGNPIGGVEQFGRVVQAFR